MATKTTKKKTTKKTAAKTSAAVKQPKTVKECIAQYDVLRLHVTIITVLSILVCGLVAALILTIARN